jgi:hypothetical protein
LRFGEREIWTGLLFGEGEREGTEKIVELLLLLLLLLF